MAQGQTPYIIPKSRNIDVKISMKRIQKLNLTISIMSRTTKGIVVLGIVHGNIVTKKTIWAEKS